MSSPLRVAMIGLDHWYTANSLAESLARHPDVELVGIADADESRARPIAARAGVSLVVPDGEAFLTDDSIDLIASFVSTERNPQICVAAAENGRHILSVKPLARTLEQATDILSAVRKGNVRFFGAESRPRHSPYLQQVRDWVREGRFGQLVTASASLWSRLPQGWPGASDPGWFADPDRAPGGAWIDHSIYQIDQLRYVTGASVKRVSGIAANLKYTDLPVEDYGLALVEFDNGMVASIEDTWTAPPGGGRQNMSLVGSEGGLVHDTLTGRLSLSGGLHSFDGWIQVAPPAMRAESLDPIITTIRGEDEPVATVEDAWQNLAACEAFYRAIATGTAAVPQQLPAS